MSQDQNNNDPIRTHFQVSKADLPLHCPMSKDSIWDSHPRVFLDIEKTGEAKCPYCGDEYQLSD